jgi:hypothetical protein
MSSSNGGNRPAGKLKIIKTKPKGKKKGKDEVVAGQVSMVVGIDYKCNNSRFWLSAHNCRVIPTPTSQNLELEQQIRIFGAD